jgi:hypothetical protein
MERPVSSGAERALFVSLPTQVSDNGGFESKQNSAVAGAPAGSLESLEGRRLLSSVTLSNGTLMIIGNDGSDNSLGVAKNGSNLIAYHNGASKSYSESSVTKIAIHGGKEEDTIWVSKDVKKPSVLKGYKGRDTISGGRGADWMYGGDDNDKLYGNDGDDSGYGEDGNDDLWGGKGKNYLSGGAGTDLTNGAGQGPATGSGNDGGGGNSNAASPKASISAQRKEIMAGHAIHVHGTGSSLGDGSPQNALYEWDFGDKGSAYNLVQGFNAAHLYEQPGTYTITLKVTNQAGKSHTTSTSVKVAPDTRKRIYVSEAGKDSNSGTQSSPIRSFARAAEIVNSADDIEILFRRGDTFDAGTVMNIKGDNVVISSYGSGASPVIRWTDNADGFPTIISPKGDDNVVEYLTFTSTTSNPPQAIRPSGNNVTLRGNTFKRVGYAINANGKPDGLLVQGNAAPDTNGIISYFVWGEGADHVYLGNKVANSNEEHAIRVVGADRVLVWDNDLTNTVGDAPGDNTPKGALTLHKGSYYWVARNALNEGPVAIGPLGNGDGMNDKGARFRYGVFDGNTFDTKVAIDHGAERIMFRNNVIKSGETAILIEGRNSSYDRTTNDVAIVNNTVINNNDTGRFISVEEGAVGVTLANNLYVAPNLTTGSGASASVYVHGDDLSSFKSIGNNVWAKAESNLWAQGGQNYVWPSWSNASGYRDAGEWNGMSQVGTDYFSDVSISGFTPSGDSTAASAGRYFEGVFQDRYGKDRPNSGTWTAGAIQR